MADLEDTHDPHRPLDQISTRWTQVHNPSQFVVRYTPALADYLRNLLKDEDAAEDVLQEFMVKVVGKGFDRAHPDRGRFRDYLKVAVRNQALTFLRRKKPASSLDESHLQGTLADDTPSLDERWLHHWRSCLIEKAWRCLERHEHAAPDSLLWTVLRLTLDHPDADSDQLAEMARKSSGRAVTAESFRKQRSRARRRFAELLLAEVVSTLDPVTPETVDEEVRTLGLMPYLHDTLPGAERNGRGAV